MEYEKFILHAKTLEIRSSLKTYKALTVFFTWSFYIDIFLLSQLRNVLKKLDCTFDLLFRRSGQEEMGNTNAQMKVLNQSNRNIRVFLTKSKLEVDAFIVRLESQGRTSLPYANGVRRFCFRGDVLGHRILASQTRQLPWEEDQHISIFIEDEDDERICSKHVCICMPLSCPTAIILYDV